MWWNCGARCFEAKLRIGLLVAALGLAITFGLMGVINMAHGEIIVVGAYNISCTEYLWRWRLRAFLG